ncbi:MAG: hypothetical protein AB1782_01570 [Cyanobacteriota bacterium]
MLNVYNNIPKPLNINMNTRLFSAEYKDKNNLSGNNQISFGSAAAAGGMMAGVSKAATNLILKINQSRLLPGPLKSWSTYMIANVPILSNVVFKSPITEGDLIFATAAALPFARTVSETKERRREAFLRDMSGFVIFLTCVRAVQGLEWEKALKFMSQAKPLQALAKDKSINLMGMVTRMFPDTQNLLSELARIDKIDDVIKAASKSGTLDDVINTTFKTVKEPGVKDAAMSFFKRVPKAKEHFVSSIQSAATGNGLKSTLTSLNKLKRFRSVAGAIIGGIAYILISGIGINKLNQYLAKRDKMKKQQTKDISPKGIPFSAKVNEGQKLNLSTNNQISAGLDLKQVAGGHLSNRDHFLAALNTLDNQ